ncbi:MAG: glycosyltransferase family 4 protein [Verrucomicrobiales bacterium]|nr:glycosyltransferase family 4 protein [Verrucomicrobiales bacterium]
MRVAIVLTDNREDRRLYHLPQPVFGPAPEALLEGFAELGEPEIHIISCLQKPVQPYARIAPNIHYHALHVPKIGWLRTGYQGCVRAVRRKLRALRPDIVHGQGTERECALCAVLSGFPNVVTVHGIMQEVKRALNAGLGSFHWFAAAFERFTLRRAGGVVCNSTHTEAVVRRFNIRTWRVPNALRRAFLESTPSQPSGLSKCRLLNVGSIYPLKRQVELARLAKCLRQSGLEFEFHFVGACDPTTAYGRAFLSEVESPECKGWLMYHGALPAEEMLRHYDHASALVHVSAAESFGLVVAEALARNLKLFAFRVGGVPDIAEGVDGAELVSDGDWAELGRRIAAWIKAGWPRPQTAAAVMRQRYHPTEIARRHIQIYREVLGQAAG